MSMESFTEKAQQSLRVQINERQARAFSIYSQSLIEWNNKFNLTAITDEVQIEEKHFLDSLSCLTLIRGLKVGEMIDVGTGAGFPGIPLKIMLPDLQLTLLESIGKKVEFCNYLVGKLELRGVTVIQGRAEDLGQDATKRERYDLGIARAVANLPVLAEYILPLVRSGGKMIAQKGMTAPEEVQRANHAIDLLGGCFQKLVPVKLPGISEERYLVLIDKIKTTPAKYPRRAGLPAKKPL
jgi:16S rRNA (guanine527-N7)-methyltransferase